MAKPRNRPLVKYVLALELKRVWDQTEGLFTSEEEIETAYYAKAEEVRAAAAAVSAQDEKYKLALGDLEASREDLEARRSGRLEDVIKRVSELSPRVPAGAGAGPAARAT
jgi:hypothetical protein